MKIYFQKKKWKLFLSSRQKKAKNQKQIILPSFWSLKELLKKNKVGTISQDNSKDICKWFNPIQDGSLWGCSQTWEGQQGPSFSKICHTYTTMMKIGTALPYLKKNKKYMNHLKRPLKSADISAFYRKLPNFPISRNKVTYFILTYNF